MSTTAAFIRTLALILGAFFLLIGCDQDEQRAAAAINQKDYAECYCVPNNKADREDQHPNSDDDDPNNAYESHVEIER